jgi:hypothetical protein
MASDFRERIGRFSENNFIFIVINTLLILANVFSRISDKGHYR